MGIFSFEGYSQKNIVKANMFYNSQLYDQAIEYFVKEVALNDKNTKKDAMIKLAFCYKQTGQFIEAENIYRELMKQYGKREPVYIFEYANALRSSSKYAEAIQAFEQYKKVKPNDPLADQSIESCILAEQWLVETPDYYVRLIPEINTETTEICPVLVGDTIVFSSSRQGSVKKTVDVKEGGKSTMLDLYYVPLGKQPLQASNKGFLKGVNTYMHEGPATFSADGTVVYFTRTVKGKKERKDTPVTLQIYVSRRDASGKWSEPKSAVQFNSLKYSVAHPSLSSDGKRLYFASDMPGGKGGTDIYMSELNKVGQWGAPVNLGSHVNTIGNELTPFILNDSVLYFSSDFHPGMGKKDIFSAKKIDGVWQDVQNLKPPINTLANDFGFVRFPDEDKGFFTSDRFNGIGREDIYAFITTEPLHISYALPNFVIKDDSFYNQASYQLDFGDTKDKIDLYALEGSLLFAYADSIPVVLNERREGLPYNRITIAVQNSEDTYFNVLIRPQQVPITFGGVVHEVVLKDTLLYDSTKVSITEYKTVANVKVGLYSRNKLIEEVVSDRYGAYRFTTQLQARRQYEIIAKRVFKEAYLVKGRVINSSQEQVVESQVFIFERKDLLARIPVNEQGEFSYRLKSNSVFRVFARAEGYESNFVDVITADSLFVDKLYTIVLQSKTGAPKITPTKVQEVPLKKIESFYTILLVATSKKKSVQTIQKEYGISDVLFEYYDANLYKYVVGKYDSLPQAHEYNNAVMKKFGGSVKYVVDGKFYDIDKKPSQIIVEGKIVDETQKPIQADIEFNDNETNMMVVKTESDKQTGMYRASLLEGGDYGMYVSKDGYIFHSENINLKSTNQQANKDTTVKRNIAMQPAVPGNSIVLNNIFFDYGKSSLRESSLRELEHVVKFLKDNPSIRVEISGHTCNTSSWAFNKKLSDARATSVRDYLVSKGIQRARLVAIGYSFDRPIADNRTEEGKQKNRRTEFKIIQ